MSCTGAEQDLTKCASLNDLLGLHEEEHPSPTVSFSPTLLANQDRTKCDATAAAADAAATALAGDTASDPAGGSDGREFFLVSESNEHCAEDAAITDATEGSLLKGAWVMDSAECEHDCNEWMSPPGAEKKKCEFFNFVPIEVSDAGKHWWEKAHHAVTIHALCTHYARTMHALCTRYALTIC
jgi:hypothetical protein